MEQEKIRFCWYCQQPYFYERKTSRYCSANCRVQDNNKQAQEIKNAIFDLQLKQKTDRMIKSNELRWKYNDNMEHKKELNE